MLIIASIRLQDTSMVRKHSKRCKVFEALPALVCAPARQHRHTHPVCCRLYLQSRGHRCVVHVAATQQQQQKRYVTKMGKRPAGRPGHHRKGTSQVAIPHLLTLVNTCPVSLHTAVGAASLAELQCLCTHTICLSKTWSGTGHVHGTSSVQRITPACSAFWAGFCLPSLIS